MKKKQFDPRNDFPARIYFTKVENFRSFVDEVGEMVENYGQITLIDFFDILSVFEFDTYGTITAEFKSMHPKAILCNYGWRVSPVKSYYYTSYNADGYKWVLKISSPIFLEKENKMTYKDIKTTISSALEYCGYDDMVKNYGVNITYKEGYYARRVFKPERILKNGHATIFFWKDGSKTVVKAAEGDEMDLYNAFCIASMKRLFRTNSAIKSCLRHTLIEGDWK